MAIILLIAGLLLSVALDHWLPFAVSTVLAAIVLWSTDAFLHDHIHELTEEDNEHGKTVN